MLSGTSRMLPPSPKRLERDEAHTPQRSLAIDRVAQDDRLLADIQVLMGEQRGVMAVITGQTTAHADVRDFAVMPIGVRPLRPSSDARRCRCVTGHSCCPVGSSVDVVARTSR